VRRAALSITTLAFSGAVLVVAALRLVALNSVPHGLYIDEASIGYNAWAIAHGGVDEHGASWPLFFQAFGEYKGPAYIYLLAPLTRLLPLSPATVRLPAALAGLGVCVLLALIALRLTGSRIVALLMLATAAVEPWLAVQSRTALEADSLMVFGLLAACWLVVRAQGERAWLWFLGAGALLALTIYTYFSARLFVALMAGVLIVAWISGRQRRFAVLAVLPPLLAGYAVLGVWALGHPGALTARLDQVSVAWDHPTLQVIVRRTVDNYIAYLGFPFLFTHGDSNLRHNSGYGGMVLISTAPAFVAGFIYCLQHWREAMPRFVLLALALAPVPAALTAAATPHARRAATMLPFILLLALYGRGTLLPYLKRWRFLAAGLALVAAVEAGGFFYDLYFQWPSRALSWFDAGQGEAIARGYDLAAGRQLVLSSSLDVPYIQADFWLKPDPRLVAANGLTSINVTVLSAGQLYSARPGAILVLTPSDVAPGGARLLDEETVTVDRTFAATQHPDSEEVVLATIWRR